MDIFITELLKIANKVDPNNIFWLLSVVAFFKYAFPELKPSIENIITYLNDRDKRIHEHQERSSKALVKCTETIQNLEHIINELVATQKTKCAEHWRKIESYINNISEILKDIARENDDFAPMCENAQDDLTKIKDSFRG